MAFERALLTALDAAYLAALAPQARRFAQATRDVAATQARLLRQLLAANAESAFGRQHGFATLDSVAAYQGRVPIASYADVAPWIDRVAAGEAHVLTAAPVRVLEPTAGSTARPKLIPCTAPFLAEINAATGPWFFDLIGTRPALWGTRSYWSLSPAARQSERTAGGIRIGFTDDTDYLGRGGRWLWQQKMAVPSRVGELTDLDVWQRETLVHLLGAADLGLISIWSPTFLSGLMRTLTARFDDLAALLVPERRRQIVAAVRREGGLTGRALWPRLSLISCWTEGNARLFLPELQRWFPGVEIQGKGLIATEGVVSFPLRRASQGAVAAITSHFLEFEAVDDQAGPPRLAHELDVGAAYSPILTTGGGLHRYRLNDRVTCVGKLHQAPLLRFDGKRDETSDLCGEKLDAVAVETALERAAATVHLEVRFALITPHAAAPTGYHLLVESPSGDAPVAAFTAEVERLLCDNYHYRYCRDLGQLQPLRAIPVTDGWARYTAARMEAGARLGSIKPLGLDASREWSEILSHEAREPER